MSAYLLVYHVEAPLLKDSGFVNVCIEGDPIDWWIKFKSNILSTNPVKYFLVNYMPITQEQFEALKNED